MFRIDVWWSVLYSVWELDTTWYVTGERFRLSPERTGKYYETIYISTYAISLFLITNLPCMYVFQAKTYFLVRIYLTCTWFYFFAQLPWRVSHLIYDRPCPINVHGFRCRKGTILCNIAKNGCWVHHLTPFSINAQYIKMIVSQSS